MIIVYGTRLYGRIRACGRSFLATQFFHIWYVPLIPVGTRLVLEEMGGQYRALNAPFSFKSMMAAYLRVWGPLGVIIALVSGLSTLEEVSDDPLALVVAGAFLGVVLLALVAGTVLSWAFLGRLSDEEKRQRSVYALHTGYFVDPAEMGDARHALREGLMGTIVERARGLASMGYRMSADPVQAWPHVALDPTQNDEQLVTAAFTLARLDGSLAQGPWKTQLDQIHQQLWQRISHANPQYLNAHRQFS